MLGKRDRSETNVVRAVTLFENIRLGFNPPIFQVELTLPCGMLESFRFVCARLQAPGYPAKQNSYRRNRCAVESRRKIPSCIWIMMNFHKCLDMCGLLVVSVVPQMLLLACQVIAIFFSRIFWGVDVACCLASCRISSAWDRNVVLVHEIESRHHGNDVCLVQKPWISMVSGSIQYHFSSPSAYKKKISACQKSNALSSSICLHVLFVAKSFLKIQLLLY